MMKIPTNETELLQLFIEKTIKGEISQSPYSASYYICETKEDLKLITWGSKPKNSFRISTHWNFGITNQHCKLKNSDQTKEVRKYLLARWDIESGEYEELLEVSDDFYRSITLLNNIDFLKERIKSEEDSIRECSPRFKFNNNIEISLENGIEALEYLKTLENKISQYLIIARRKERKLLLNKIAKNKKLKEELITYLNIDGFKMLEQGNRRYKMSVLYRRFGKFSKLFTKCYIKNESPRGGKIHDVLMFNKKEQQKILKQLQEK